MTTPGIQPPEAEELDRKLDELSGRRAYWANLGLAGRIEILDDVSIMRTDWVVQ